MISPTLLAKEFPQPDELIYLNHAAVSPWPLRASEAIVAFARENSLLGAEHYPRWAATEQLLREQLQTLINAPSVSDIALLKNTSEALSVVAAGIDWHAGDNIVSTDEEFPSNRLPWEAQQEHGVTLKQISLSSEDPEAALIAACDEQTRLMSISSVQYGSGFRLDLEKLGRHCRRNNILFCVDAIQSIGCHQFDVQKIQADFAMADAHKWMLGPEGIAVFYCRKEIREQLKLHQFGWHMVEHAGDYDRKDWQPAASARRFECGSPNMLGTHALSASLSLLLEVGMQNVEAEILRHSARIVSGLQDIKGVELLSATTSQRHAGIITFKVAGCDLQRLYKQLMQNRVICAHRFGGIRFSPHFYSREDKIERALTLLNKLIE